MTTRSVKSAERTLALLELFSARQEPLTVGQVTKALSIPQASASMLLGSLRTLGYLTYDPRRRTYAPTVRVTLLGGLDDGRVDRGSVLRAGLRTLRDRLDLTVFLVVQNEATAQVAFVLARRHAPAPSVRPGDRRPISMCAAGHALLSCRSDQEVIGWAHRCGAEAAANEPRVAAMDLLRTVRTVRENGFARTDADPSFGHGAIAALVGGAVGLPRVAVGVGLSTPIADTRRSSIVRELQKVSIEGPTAPRSISGSDQPCVPGGFSTRVPSTTSSTLSG